MVFADLEPINKCLKPYIACSSSLNQQKALLPIVFLFILFSAALAFRVVQYSSFIHVIEPFLGI